jgi:glyoxylase-like metal-dependent hydrolase (beta-lactamase superfamily II)
MKTQLFAFALALMLVPSLQAETTRFCLEGEFDLGARYQGVQTSSGQFYPTTWCVVTDSQTERVQFTARGNTSPDMDGSWAVAYEPPDLVRIINSKSPPDIEFQGTDNAAEAHSVRRLDPHRLAAEFLEFPERFENMNVDLDAGSLQRVEATVDMPLRGKTPVIWEWSWADPDAPQARLLVDGQLTFRASGRWETLTDEQAQAAWTATPGADPVQLGGELWPAQVAPELINLTDGVYLVRNVRTGFRHIVVDTDEGLVIGDAPAGWIELHQVPPGDLVPGLGLSGLSENFVDFLKQEFPGRDIAAVVLTHFHDDHAGGARAFAAEGALVYAPSSSEAFLEKALNRKEMPSDRLAEKGSAIDIVPIAEAKTLGEGPNRVRLVPLGANPHVDAMLGLWVVDRDYFFVSDVHVPRSEEDAPAPERAATECWFAAEAVALLPETARVISSHSGIVTPVSRLKAYLDSAPCQAG